MGVLGKADEYNVVIVDSASQEPLAHLPWSKIEWQRARNKVTRASAFIATEDLGVYQNGRALVSSLRTWNQMMRIERNGHTVWDGPITGWGRAAVRTRHGDAKFGISITAWDRWVISMKAIIGGDFASDSAVGAYWPLPPLPLPIPTMIGGGTAIPWALIYASGLYDTPSTVPWPITLPAREDFSSGFGRLRTTGVNQTFHISTPLERVYRTARLERLDSALDELCGFGYLSYAQVVDKLWVNDLTMRTVLGGSGDRPTLSENTCLNTDGIQVDGFDQATVVYFGGQSTGKAGFANVTAGTPLPYTFVSGTLEAGTPIQAATERGESTVPTGAEIQARAALVRKGAPAVTIEQLVLAPTFGSPSMRDDLSNLVPGVVVDVNFPETSGLDIPFVDVILQDRQWGYSTVLSGFIDGVLLTPVYETSITKVRLEQFDVTVDAVDGPMAETFAASTVPYADWDGHQPWASWLEPEFDGYQAVSY